MTQAVEKARSEGQRLLDQARAAAETLAAKRATALRAESAGLYESLAKRTQQEVFAIARKTLTDLAAAAWRIACARRSWPDCRPRCQRKQALGKSLRQVRSPRLCAARLSSGRGTRGHTEGSE